MAVRKQKTVCKSSKDLFKKSRLAGKKAIADPAIEADHDDQLSETMQQEQIEIPSVDEQEAQPAEEQAKEEEQTVIARKKELKAMPVDDLKMLISQHGLETGKKDFMVEALASHEAKARADVRERAASMREAVVEKKKELERLALPDLVELSAAHGIRGILKKQARVEQLLEHWLADNGVEKALAKRARDSREEALGLLDKRALFKLCEKSGVNPFVDEVMIERIVRQEGAAGFFERPVLDNVDDDEAKEKQTPDSATTNADVVEALLAKEANRKKVKELQQMQEEAATKKRKELAAMTNEALKKALVSKGAEALGKKEDMVEALFALCQQEDAVQARRTRLTAMDLDELKKLCACRNLDSCKKAEMVDALLAYEEKRRQEICAFERMVDQSLARREEELLSKSATELKELCASKGLKSASSKEDLVRRLVEIAKLDGSADELVAAMMRRSRMETLRALTSPELHALCEKKGLDALVKEVMVERLLASEFVEEPPAKRRRQ